jgi:subtilase-type serine protease
MCHTLIGRSTVLFSHPSNKTAHKKLFAVTALFAALCALWATGANANEFSYSGDTGFVAKSEAEVAAAKASWETAEYLRSGGLAVLKASSAYALGYFGQNRTVGVMDSGALDSHPDFQGDRWTFVTQKGAYGTSGQRYRGSGYFTNLPAGGRPLGEPYQPGEAFDLTGAYDPLINDSHGTSVTGIVGANRDGDPAALNMHGIAFGTNMVIGNTGATDSNNYGPYQDYNFFYTGWKAMAEAGAEIINNSWGTNIRINLVKNTNATSGSYYPFDNSGGAGQDGVADNSVKGRDGGNIGNMIPTNNVPQAEYEYFYFNKMYGDGRSFVDAAYDVAQEYGTVFIMTTGNRDNASPFYRALYPYFHPEAERYWIAAAGIMKDAGNPGKLVLVNAINSETGASTGTTGSYNEAGLAKWWTMTGYTLTDAYTTNLQGSWGTGSFSGTSCAAPHLAGAMGVLMSRYLNMTAMQVRDVMFTTGTNRNPDGSTFDGWTSADGVPDERYGWGLPDLEKGMYGPGQFLGKLEYVASVAPLDVWSNDISQVANDARKQEDLAWLNQYKTHGINGLGLYNEGMDARGGYYAPAADYELGTSFVVADNDDDPTNHIVSQADAEKWRKAYADARAAAIEEKLALGLYDGSLVKKGEGTLVMTGNNTYAGGTEVYEGTLLGFTESFGTGTVLVKGGTLGILETYDDPFTLTGTKTTAASPAQTAKVEVDDGGTLMVIADQDVHVDSLTFKKGAKVTVGAASGDVAQEVYDNNTTATGTITGNTVTDFAHAVISPTYVFLETTLDLSGNTISATLSKNATASYAAYGNDANERAIAGVLDKNPSGNFYNALPVPLVTQEELRNTLDSLGSDLYLNADTSSVMNTLGTAKAVANQARGLGAGRNEALNDHARVWALGVGSWSTVDHGHADMDVDHYVGLIGVEADVNAAHTGGLFFGAGTTKFKGGKYGKIKSDDLTVGLYGVSDVANAVSLSYGLTHTRQDRDADRVLTVGAASQSNAVSTNAKITELFVEAAYTQLSLGGFGVEPYVGLGVVHIKSDGFTERVGDMTFTTSSNKQTAEVGTLGVRGKYPLTVGAASLAATADVSGTFFFGDTKPEATMTLDNTGRARLEGSKLKSLINVGLGLEAAVGKTVTFGVSYVGAYNSDIKSNGLQANVRVSF